MLEWIPALATVAGATLASAIATDSWTAAKDGLVAVFHPAGEGRRAALVRRLNNDTAAVTNAEASHRDEVRGDVAAEWRTRLADLLEEYPEARDELRAWADRVQTQHPAPSPSWTQHNAAHDHGTVYAVQGGGAVHVQQVTPSTADDRAR